MTPKIPEPTIYLRNKFSVRPGMTGRFFEGQDALLRHTRLALSAKEAPSAPAKHKAKKNAKLGLVAACGEAPLIQNGPVPEHLPEMMHIWQLPSWSTLYQLMYTFTESDWYASEVSSLETEHQDLLIGIGSGIELEPRPATWDASDTPGYVYLYDEVRLDVGTTKLAHLRQLNWFASQVAPKSWHLTWVGTEMTGTPSRVCILWRVPSVMKIESTLQFMAYDSSVSARYAKMMAGIQHLSRKYLFPESTEWIDNNPAQSPSE